MYSSPQEIGLNAEKYLQAVLGKKFPVVKPKTYNNPYDLLVNGKRVEIKAARPLSTVPAKWVVNIQRHSKLNESEVDIYAILLDLRQLGKVKPLILFRAAPIGSPSIIYSIESLLTIHHPQIENWKIFEK